MDWNQNPMEEFKPRFEPSSSFEDGIARYVEHPQGEGRAQQLMADIAESINRGYAYLLPREWDPERDDWVDEWYIRGTLEGKTFEEGDEHDTFEGYVEVPVIRGGHYHYERLDSFTLEDLPAILGTFAVLQEERDQREEVRSRAKEEERKRVKRVRAKERRKLKKLGEW